MNQVYRALHMPPDRLFKKLTGQKEIYTIALRPIPPEAPLPALGEGAYTPLPFDGRTWYADPLLYHHGEERWIFCEAFDLAAGRGDIAAIPLAEDGTLGEPRVVLSTGSHLSFPTVFDWRGETWMIPESSALHTLDLYRCAEFPGKWEQAACFQVGCELCDTIVLDKTNDELTLLCSETRPENQLYTRYRRYTLRHTAGQEDTGLVSHDFELEPDEPFNLQHREYGLGFRNAGPMFELGGQTIHPTQVSTKVDYGVYLQFFARRGASEIPLCAAEPHIVIITGLNRADVVGIHTYCRDDRFEVIDARYLTRLPKQPAVPAAAPGPAAPAAPGDEPSSKGEPED